VRKTSREAPESELKQRRQISTAPSFRKLRTSSSQASRALAGNRATDTKCERLLRSELWRLGLRFRKNVRSLPGKPDVVFRRERVVVFCDGDFWHGKNWESRRRRLRMGSNPEYWVAKIQSNIARDRSYDRRLEQFGWKVVRLWESQILADPVKSARQVQRLVLRRRAKLDPHPGMASQ
jgi:DNA mismatch endonuclease, patch repair protein